MKKAHIVICIIVLALPIAICSASFAGQLGSELKLQSDGPTLEETIAFIERNINTSYHDVPSLRSETTFKLCEIEMQEYFNPERDSTDGHPAFDYSREWLSAVNSVNLKDVIRLRFFENGGVVMIELITAKKFKGWGGYPDYAAKNRQYLYVKGSPPEYYSESRSLVLKDVTMEERVSNALGHAIKLCGGKIQRDPF